MNKLKAVINKLLFSSILLFTIITITAVSNKYISVYTFVKDSEQVTLIKEVTNTFVTNPAYNEGYPLGSEVTLNNGVLRGNTITE